jgi:hypothetical protein
MPNLLDDLLRGRDPTQNEQWVAACMANHALEKLCVGLIIEFADFVPPIDPPREGDEPRPTATAIIHRLLGGVSDLAELRNWTDLEPGLDFDMDVAKRVALEMIEDHLRDIRRTALNER